VGSFNRVILIGNLGKDAELRFTPGGAAVAALSIATADVWNDKSGARQERTTWHRCVLWGKGAESLAEYLTKGKQIAVEGKLQNREYTDKEQQRRFVTEIRIETVVLLGANGLRERRGEGDQHLRDEDVGGPRDGNAPPEDDIPF
jgi:single-strand DNA-binding protein